jgi:hypothetical protein
MAVIELHTFRLADAGSEDAFLDADARAQTEFAYRQGGLVRRTTARAGDAEWLTVTLWASDHDADAAASAAHGDAAASAWHALIDATSADLRRYRTLD